MNDTIQPQFAQSWDIRNLARRQTSQTVDQVIELLVADAAKKFDFRRMNCHKVAAFIGTGLLKKGFNFTAHYGRVSAADGKTYWRHCWIDCEGRRIDPAHVQFADDVKYEDTYQYTPAQFLVGVLLIPKQKKEWLVNLVRDCYQFLDLVPCCP